MKTRHFLVLGLILTMTAATAYARPQVKIPPDSIVVRIDARGILRLGEEQIEFSSLTQRLRDFYSASRDSTVVVVGSADADFKEVVRIVDAARTAGIERVGILKSQADGSPMQSRPPAGAILVSLSRNGDVRLDGKKVKISAIPSQLQRIFRQRTDRAVYVQAYRTLSVETVTSVIDAAKAGGATRIGLLHSDEY